MASVTIELPEAWGVLLGVIAQRAGCPPQDYAYLCFLLGLADQMRCGASPDSMDLARRLTRDARALAAAHGLEVVSL